MTIAVFLYLIAFCLLLAAGLSFGYRRASFGWLGLALWLFTWALLPHIG